MADETTTQTEQQQTQEPNNVQTPTNQQQPSNLMQNQAYIESERERIRLQQENETLRNQQQQRPQVDYDEANKDFFSRPLNHMSETIRNEVQNTIAPIANKFDAFMRSQTYQQLKTTYRQLQNFNLVEQNVDTIMANLEPTAANMNAAISMAMGQLVLSGHNFNTQTNTQQQTQQTTQYTPPNLSSSPPAAPAHSINNAAKITLTELQKRVARENGMTDEQYIAYLTADARQVTSMEVK